MKYLRVALAAVGVFFIVGNLQSYRHLAVWLVVALGTVAPPATLPTDNPEALCDIGCFSLNREPQSPPTFESNLVHGVVQRCAWHNHGDTGFGEPRAHRTSVG